MIKSQSRSTEAEFDTAAGAKVVVVDKLYLPKVDLQKSWMSHRVVKRWKITDGLQNTPSCLKLMMPLVLCVRLFHWYGYFLPETDSNSQRTPQYRNLFKVALAPSDRCSESVHCLHSDTHWVSLSKIVKLPSGSICNSGTSTNKSPRSVWRRYPDGKVCR
ncbi:hypothetical protein BT96DRAFT_930973 [Gymnopus androsaceus JB14]|uniref:Uncharacterized protein n=1 Tax=Gymnopus androsaceus JB14 TaxID=1447944 RepID=A0A6A4ISF3_9AGAR|nr:hypothetical protein BT96DRAFT_930973 [Gymnopus androsaceus JB14]